jgi:hypothetical protein
MRFAALFKQLALAAAVSMLPAAASAQAYPARAIKIIVPAPPGGAIDLIARVVGEKLQASMGQPVVIDNKPGAGTNIAMRALIDSPPDGHTLMLVANAVADPCKIKLTMAWEFSHCGEDSGRVSRCGALGSCPGSAARHATSSPTRPGSSPALSVTSVCTTSAARGWHLCCRSAAMRASLSSGSDCMESSVGLVAGAQGARCE